MKKVICIFALSCCLIASAFGQSESQPATGTDYTLFDPLVDVIDLVQKNYVSQTHAEDLVSGAINGMLHELDPYSEYIPAKDLDEFQKHAGGNYEGLGIGIDVQDGYLIVISPFEGSPAFKAGLQNGDLILEVNGQSTKGWSATKAVKHLTGPAGTSVKLKIIHSDGEEKEYTIVREKILVPTVRGWRRNTVDDNWDFMLDEESRIGYIRISQFTSVTVEEFEKAIDQLRDQNVQAVILDLRSNPGGVMGAAIGIVDHLIDHGIILKTKGTHTREDVVKAQSQGTYPRFHMVVLIDQGSASASEIVAGSLQDNGRAVIVGKRSWGKGSVQRVIRLPDSGGALKLTTDYYYLPKGRCVHRLPNAEVWGVTPDVEEGFNVDELDDLRELMTKLSQGKAAIADKSDDDAEKEDTAANENKLSDEELKAIWSDELIDLDQQIGQAYKQCKGLIRTQPALSAIAGSFSETESEQQQ